MALLKQTNPIVTTYPMYIVPMSNKYDEESLWKWLMENTKHAGLGRTMNIDFTLAWRVFARLEPKLETLFILKYNATLR